MLKGSLSALKFTRLRSSMRQIVLGILLLLFTSTQQPAAEPIVRIGLNQNAATVTIRSASRSPSQRTTRSATFASVLAVDPGAAAGRGDRPAVPRHGGARRRRPWSCRLARACASSRRPRRSRSRPAPIAARSEVFGNCRRTLTIVNELPLEKYLRGVVPNELNPATFGQLEALKAQAVAARTYIQRNLGQYKNEGYDICATDACQVYFGALTEDPLATQAVMDTRGVVATYRRQADQRAVQLHVRRPHRGRRTHLRPRRVPVPGFDELRVQAPEPLPFTTSRSVPELEGRRCSPSRGVDDSRDAARFMGVARRGEPASADPAALASFIRQTFYPSVLTTSDVSFVTEQGILTAGRRGAAQRNCCSGWSTRKGRSNGSRASCVVGRREDALTGRRPAAGVHAHPGCAHLPAHRGRPPGDAQGHRGSAAS